MVSKPPSRKVPKSKPNTPPVAAPEVEATSIPRKPTGEIVSITRQEVTISSGPLPDPETLRKYTTEQQKLIFEMASKEQSHRHLQDSKLVDATVVTDRRAQYISGGIAVAALTTAAVIAIFGDGTTSAIFVALGGIIVPLLGPIVGRILEYERKPGPSVPKQDQKNATGDQSIQPPSQGSSQ